MKSKSIVLSALFGLALASATAAPEAHAQSMVSSVPNGYTACATDGKACQLAAGVTSAVYYGANGTFAVAAPRSGTFTCLPNTFGIADPVPGVLKTCYVQNSPAVPSATGATATSVPTGFRACATDGNRCSASGAWTGYYGANGTFKGISGSGAFTCLPSTFNIADPVPGVQKTCYVQESGTTTTTTTTTTAPPPAPSGSSVTAVPAGFSPCVTDGGRCAANGSWSGYYGANGKFVAINGSGAFTCLPNTWGIPDPVPGVQKTCYVTAAALSGTTTTSTTAAGGTCSWLSQSNTQYSRSRPSVDDCSCTCAANMAKYCTYQGTQIRSPVCRPGQYP